MAERAGFDAPAGFTIRLARPDEVDRWLDGVDALLPDNGANGVFYSPYSAHEPPPPRPPERIEGYGVRMDLPPVMLAWLRVFLAEERASGALAGHADLRGAMLEAEGHRCTFGLGVLPAFQRRGLGRALTQAAIEWARAQPSLAWIDLGVFHSNLRAQALYRAMGFVEQGRRVDRFRVDGVSIDDVQMALRLRR